MERRTGAWVFGYGVVLLIVATVLMFWADTETWATVALVVGLLGGFGLGTGMSILMIPADDADLSDHYDDDLPYIEGWTDPDDDAADTWWTPRCPVHGRDMCAMPTRHCPPHRAVR